jgi:hypothetical protein
VLKVIHVVKLKILYIKDETSYYQVLTIYTTHMSADTCLLLQYNTLVIPMILRFQQVVVVGKTSLETKDGG